MSAGRVLVTGATGFIGSALARRLVDEGAETHLLVRSGSDPGRLAGCADRCRRHIGDLGDAQSLARCLRAARPRVVFHLAKERAEGFESCAQATMRLGAVLRREAPRLERLVRTAHAAEGPLGRAKDGYLARGLRERLGLPVVTLELFSVYGPGQRGEEFPAAFIRAALGGRRPDPPRGGGLLDFVFVEDVARAYLSAAERAEALGASIPVGSGAVHTREEAAALVLEKLGLAPAGLGLPARAPGLEGHAADTRPAARLLGWTARTQLSAGLDRMIAAMKDAAARGR